MFLLNTVLSESNSHVKPAELIEKIESKKDQNFTLSKTLKAHVQPLTNCAFNKNGDRLFPASSDSNLSTFPLTALPLTGSSRVRTIERARSGTLRQEISCILLKATRTWSTASHSIIHSEIKWLQVHSIKQQK